MSRMIFDLTDEDRALLETHRVRLGCRSHAEALRTLIRGQDGEPAMAAPPTPSPSFSHGRSKTVVVPAGRQRSVSAAVPLIERKAFNPQPKTGKKK